MGLPEVPSGSGWYTNGALCLQSWDDLRECTQRMLQTSASINAELWNMAESHLHNDFSQGSISLPRFKCSLLEFLTSPRLSYLSAVWLRERGGAIWGGEGSGWAWRQADERGLIQNHRAYYCLGELWGIQKLWTLSVRLPRTYSCSPNPLTPHPHPKSCALDNLRREDAGLCQDAEEQVQVEAVLQQTPSERLPTCSVCTGGRELRDVSHTHIHRRAHTHTLS